MKTPANPLPPAQPKAHALNPYSDDFPPEHSMLDGTLFSQHRPQDLFTKAQLFPSKLPDACKAMPGRSHQIEG